MSDNPSTNGVTEADTHSIASAFQIGAVIQALDGELYICVATSDDRPLRHSDDGRKCLPKPLHLTDRAGCTIAP